MADNVTAEQEPMPLCPNCGTDTVGTYVADNSFKYGVENPITLIAKDVLYFHCTECHLDFTGEDGEYKRTSAVITHLATRIESLTARRSALEAEHALDQAALEAANETIASLKGDLRAVEELNDCLEEQVANRSPAPPQEEVAKPPILRIEHGWICIREPRGWLLFSTQVSALTDIGVELRLDGEVPQCSSQPQQCEHHWSAARSLHECLNDCGATICARTGTVRLHASESDADAKTRNEPSPPPGVLRDE